MSQELEKRLSALAWSIGAMVLAMGIDFAAQNLGLFNLDPEVTVFLGLFLNQISKAIHNYLRQRTPESV